MIGWAAFIMACLAFAAGFWFRGWRDHGRFVRAVIARRMDDFSDEGFITGALTIFDDRTIERILREGEAR